MCQVGKATNKCTFTWYVDICIASRLILTVLSFTLRLALTAEDLDQSELASSIFFQIAAMSVMLSAGAPAEQRAKVLDKAIGEVMERECDTISKAIHDVMAKVGMDDLPDLVEFVKIFEGKVGTLAEELDKADLPDWANRTIMKSAKEIQTQMRDLKNADSIQDRLTKSRKCVAHAWQCKGILTNWETCAYAFKAGGH